MKKLKLFLLILPIFIFVFLFKTATVAGATCTASLNPQCGQPDFRSNSLKATWNLSPPTWEGARCHVVVWGGKPGEPGYLPNQDIWDQCIGTDVNISGVNQGFTDDGDYNIQISNGDAGCNPSTAQSFKFKCQRTTTCTLASWSLSTSTPPANTEFTATVTGKNDPDWGNMQWRVDSGAWSGIFTSVSPGPPPTFVFKPNSGAAGAHNLEMSAAEGRRLCTPKQPFTTGSGSPPPSGSCPADSKLTVSPNPANIGATMTFQYQAGEDVYIGGDTWNPASSVSACKNPGDPGNPLEDRRYICTASSATNNGVWNHYWGQPKTCGSATYTITGTPTPTPTPSTTTVSYRVAENPTDLASAPWKNYTAAPMKVDFEFVKDKTPGNKFVWVEFKDSTGKTEKKNAQITLLGPDPTITSCALSFEGVNTVLNLTGQNFGSDKGEVKSGDTALQVREWKDTTVRAVWQNAPEGKVLPVILTNPYGQTAESQCSSISQLALGAKVFCRAPSNHQTDNVDLTLVGDYEGGSRVKQKVSIDKDGVIQGLTQKLEAGKKYKLSVKAPKSLRRAASFTVGEGVTTVPNFILPVGDIFPADSGDSSINSLDKAELNRQFVISQDACGRSSDFNKDCRVNSIDWACMRYDFGKPEDPEVGAGNLPAPSPSPTPSPSPKQQVVKLLQSDGVFRD